MLRKLIVRGISIVVLLFLMLIGREINATRAVPIKRYSRGKKRLI